MQKLPSSFIQKITARPQQVLLIDAAGALFTAFLLSQVLARWVFFFGMPARVLYGLTLAAILIAGWSFTGYFLFKHRWPFFLRAAAWLNLGYCLTTVLLLILHQSTLRLGGYLYFITEILLILALVYVEWSALSRFTRGRSKKTEEPTSATFVP